MPRDGQGSRALRPRGARDARARGRALPRGALARRGVLRARPARRLVPAARRTLALPACRRLALLGPRARFRAAAAGGLQPAGALSSDLARARAALGPGVPG